MQQIYIAALVTSALCLGVIGGVLFFRTPRPERAFLSRLVLLLLPMCALAFHGVRMPLDHALASVLAGNPDLYAFIKVLYAPLTEEPAKLWPLLIPWVWRRVTRENLVRVALAIGLGFGIGEAWTVAGLLAGEPAIAHLPWYALGGFISERFMVCILHAGFTGAALYFIRTRRRVGTGLACAMLLHFIGNFPIYLAQQVFPDLGPVVWQVLLGLWVLFYWLLMAALLAGLAGGRGWFRKLRGTTQCPGCGAVYPRRLFGINLLHRSYERCPVCKRWHLVDTFSRTGE